MIAFTKRNLLVFFRDKSSVFFSLLASFIIIGLYVLFLGDVWTSNLAQFPEARHLMDNWVMAGLLAATTFTTTMGAFGIMINDKVRKIDKDFYSSPISRKSIAGGYVLSSLTIGFIMSIVTLILAELYIVLEGGAFMSLETLVNVILLILLADITNTAIVFFITSFFTSENAFATASTVIGTLIGFITGIYLPVGTLPDAVQWIVKLFPPSHAAALLRQTMMEKPIADSFAGVPAQALSDFKSQFGVIFKFGDTEISALISILILVGTAILFFALAVLNISRKKK